jgi:hypothetical protein
VSNLLPWHPRRLNDEILSSWMLRIAADLSVRRLCGWLGDDQPVRALDDSMAHTDPLIDSIAEAVGVEKEQVIECLPSSLHGLSRTPVYRPGRASPMPWRLWQGTANGKVGNQYCPACLQETGHHQLPWTIAIYTCCLRHNCFLRESCPHCGKPFRGASRFLNLDFVNPARDLQRCAYCNRSVANYAPSERADKKTLRLCHVLGSLVGKSSCENFFGVLARLLYVMCRPSALGEDLRSQMLPASHQITSRHTSGTPMNFEYLDVKSRAYMLQAVVSLFADWPDYLIETLRSTNRLHHHLHLFKDLPSWYDRAERAAMIRSSKPNHSEREKLLHVAIRQGWITAVQFAEETRNTANFLHARSV